MSLQYNMSAGRSLRAWSRRAMAQFHYIRKSPPFEPVEDSKIANDPEVDFPGF